MRSLGSLGVAEACLARAFDSEEDPGKSIGMNAQLNMGSGTGPGNGTGSMGGSSVDQRRELLVLARQTLLMADGIAQEGTGASLLARVDSRLLQTRT